MKPNTWQLMSSKFSHFETFLPPLQGVDENETAATKLSKFNVHCFKIAYYLPKSI